MDDLAAIWDAADQVAVGERLRAARRRAGLSQAQLGEGIASAGYVSRLEAGSRRGDLELFHQFASRLGVEVRSLLSYGLPAVEDTAIRLRVDYAELALASGDSVQAELSLADLTDEALTGLSADLQ